MDESPIEKASRCVSEYAHRLERPRVLDAGCGLRARVDWGPNAWLVGIDNDRDALEKNHTVHEKIFGDLHTHRFAPESFDIAVCWDVLEHLAHPQQALRNLVAALSPGGMLFLTTPHPLSLKALITKLTPHSFHVWVYRHILGLKSAGTPGHAPFPVYLRSEIAPRALRKFAREHGLEVELLEVYEGGQMRRLRRLHPILYGCVAAFSAVLFALSFGRYDARLTDTCAILRKPARVAIPGESGIAATA